MSGGTLNPTDKNHLQNSGVAIIYTTHSSILDFITPDDLPVSCGGHLEHNQAEWKEFFSTLEPLQTQCSTAGRRLIAVLSEIRVSDAQAAPNRRQLHSQHRALSRALMDSELQTLRRTGATTIRRLTDRARRISRYVSQRSVNPNTTNHVLPDATEHIIVASSSSSSSGSNSRPNNKNSCSSDKQSPFEAPDYIEGRLNEVIVVFNEVDRAARRLESLTEQRRERIREITRQKAVEEEISEVSYFRF